MQGTNRRGEGGGEEPAPHVTPDLSYKTMWERKERKGEHIIVWKKITLCTFVMCPSENHVIVVCCDVGEGVYWHSTRPAAASAAASRFLS